MGFSKLSLKEIRELQAAVSIKKFYAVQGRSQKFFNGGIFNFFRFFFVKKFGTENFLSFFPQKP